MITAVLEVAEQGGWTPAQVALAWLRSRPGNVIPIVAATKESRWAEIDDRRSTYRRSTGEVL